MTRAKPIKDLVSDLEYSLAKYKAVLKAFPDAKLHDDGFTSKTVNKAYTHYVFERRYNGLYVLPYNEIEFTYNDKTDIIKIHSQPKRNRLVYLSWRRAPDGKRFMQFSRMAINFKNNEIRDDILSDCKSEIMAFIRDYPNYVLDEKHLDPRLKKLIIFI